jgi:hypothetical protein
MMEGKRKPGITIKSLRRDRLLQLALLCLGGVFLVAAVAAQSPYTDGRAAQLNAAQIRRLKALRAPIAVPTYIPAGYRLTSADGTTEKPKAMTLWIVDYSLKYENAAGESFSLVSANEGLGDLPLNTALTGRNRFFSSAIDVGTQTDGEDLKKGVKPEYESGWIVNKSAYLPAGARSRQQSYRLTSSALSAKEVLKVMQSLRYLQ